MIAKLNANMPNRGAVAMMADARSVWPTVGWLDVENQERQRDGEDAVTDRDHTTWVLRERSVFGSVMSSLPVLRVGMTKLRIVRSTLSESNF